MTRPGDTTIKMLARGFLIFLLFLCPLGLAADSESSAKVMLFGVFHFANPGKDMVKSQQVDVMMPENQAYLEELTKRIADFKPTVVLLEFDPEDEARMQERYRNSSRARTSWAAMRFTSWAFGSPGKPVSRPYTVLMRGKSAGRRRSYSTTCPIMIPKPRPGWML